MAWIGRNRCLQRLRLEFDIEQGAPGAPIIVTEASAETSGIETFAFLTAHRGVLEQAQIVANCQKIFSLTVTSRFKTALALPASLLRLAGRQAESDESCTRSVRGNDGNRPRIFV